MLAVAVDADRRIGTPPQSKNPMDSLPVVILYPPVAFTAGAGNIEMVDRGLRIARRQDHVGGPVSRMAVITSGGKVEPSHGGFPMHATFKYSHRLLHQNFVFLD